MAASGRTAVYQLYYPLQTDVPDVAADTQSLAQGVETQLLLKAPLLTPTFTGVPAAPTASVDTNTTQIATTAYVVGQGYLKTSTAASTYAPLASPTFTGTPAAPTATAGTSTTQVATTAFVATAITNSLPLPAQAGNSGKFLTTNATTASWATIQTTDVSGLATVISGLSATYSPLNVTVNTQAATYTLVLTDSAKLVELNNASANTLYIPTDASVAFPVGTTILVHQLGAGMTTIAAVTPGTTTVVSTPGLKLRAQYSTATLVKRAANFWIASGDLIA
jgi:hypothetical protein